jgi:hypothetical protein
MAADELGTAFATLDTDEVFDVFLSHAGEQKKSYVDCLYQILVRAGGRGKQRTECFKVFLDQHELALGVTPWKVMEHAARTCRIGVPFNPVHTLDHHTTSTRGCNQAAT